MNWMRDWIQRWTPPAMLDVARRAIRRPQPAQPASSPPASPPPEPAEWEYVPEGWRYPSPGAQGWNVESVVRTQLERWPKFLSAAQGSGPLGISHEAPVPTSHDLIMSFAYVLALAAHEKKRLSVLDWGGGIGHYYVLARALMPQIELDYHCKDLPLFCEAGRKLLPEVRFHDDETCLDRTYDLVYAGSSLQYSEDWRGVAARLAEASAQYLYITRSPMVLHADSFVVLQRPHKYGYHTEYLGWFLNRDALVDAVQAAGMRLIREFLLADRHDVSNAPEAGVARGFLFSAETPEGKG
jgi:putative methyltransferase (TIGR04325 family)